MKWSRFNLTRIAVRPFLFLLYVTAALATTSDAHAGKSSSLPAAAQHLVLKWLGTAGWEIEVGQTVILVDPFLTRKEPDRSGGEWKTDDKAVLGAIKRADYIFAGHSHADHIGDVPFIAKKFGSKVIGSRTTTNLAITGGVDKSQLITVSGGEKLDFKEFSVQVIESLHGVLNRGGRRRQPAFEEITRPWPGPILGTSFVVGDCFLYLFTFGDRKVLHQSTGGFIADKIAGLHADVALLYPMVRSDTETMLKMLQPKIVYVHHFDEWRTPFSAGIPESNARRAQRFARDVATIDKQIEVITPKFFESYPLN
jgi:L-ascorbate metabolism protein UlaG (beta-lactamase superfamily)